MISEEQSWLLLTVFGCSIFGWIGSMVGAKKNNRGAGFFLGLIAGPLGILVVALTPERPKTEWTSTGVLTFVVLIGAMLFAVYWALALSGADLSLPASWTEQDAAQTAEIAPSPTPVARRAIARPVTPSPAEVAADIERRYGSKPSRR